MPTTSRVARAALALWLALALFAPTANGTSRNPTRSDLASLPAALQGVISAALGEKDPSYRVAAQGGAYRARNARQALDASLGADGMAIAAGGGQWRLKLAGWQRGASRQAAGTLATRASHNRVEVERGGVTEWWVNGPVGLQQGWTVATRPFPRDAGALVLAMEQSGSLRARIGSGRTLEVVDTGGQAVLRYGGLTAFDATGRELPVRFELAPGEVRVRVEDAGAVYPVVVDPIAQHAYLKASNTGAADSFGYSVAISGDTVVVGAPYEGSNATGVDGNQADNSALNSGAVYVFVRSGATWSQQAYLKASNTGVDDRFGSSVAISGDTVVVGAQHEDSNATGVNGNQADNSAPNSGAAYVFVRSGATWSQQAYLKASNTGADDNFGLSVAISGDTVVVGAPFEDSNATGVGGNQADDSAPSSGAAYVFVRSGTTWSPQAYLKAPNTGSYDYFGSTVAISGDTVVVGAYAEASNATGVDGNGADNTAPSSGAAYVFTRSGTTWSPQAYLKASNSESSDQFGYSVAISGDTVVVGAYGEGSNATGVDGNQGDNSAGASGAAYVFVRSGTTWSQQAYLKASNTGAGDYFGFSVAVSGDTVVVGAPFEDSNATGIDGNPADNSALDSGAAYVFVRSGATWSPQAYLKASNTGADDYFGSSVAASGDTVVVGAFFEDSNASGIDGNQADNSASSSGAAYVFGLSGPTVVSIDRGAAEPTNATSVAFSVTFSNTVAGVDSGDFALATTGTLAGASVTSVSGSGAVYTVVVGTGTGSGTLRLDLIDDDSISNVRPLGGVGAGNGSFTSGQVFTIDRAAPAVAAVSVPLAGTYVAGNSLDFTVNFGEAVVVTGTPSLALVVGGATVAATYVSGSGTGALVFRYTVQSGDFDSDGIAVGVLALNGGSAADALGNNAVLTLNGVGSTAGVLVGGPFTVTPSAGPNGSISPATPQSVALNGTAVFTITPAAGYSSSVGGTCGGTLVGNTYTTNPITAACTVVASFTQNTYTVTPSAGANGTIAPAIPQTVAHGATTTFTVTPATGYAAVVGGTCGGALAGNTYTTNAITASCTVAATFVASPTTSFTGPSATGTGNVTASFSGGGPACTYTSARFIPVTGHAASPPAGTAPSGVSFPHGLFDFTLAACSPGAPITMTVTYPSALPAGTLYWKYGPTPSDPAPHWYVLSSSVSGNVATFIIQDGNVGDDDLTANGTIVDQGGPGTGGAAIAPVPTLSEWMMALIAMLLLASGAYHARGIPRGRS